MWSRSRLLILPLLALASGLAEAGVVTGHLVDSEGHAVANALLQFRPDSGGDLPFVQGGFTDADGNFSAAVTPDGAYDIHVFPPAPPVSLVPTTRIDAVTVGLAPNALGDVVLEVGALVTGRVVSSAGAPLVAGMNFLGAPHFQKLDFTYGESNANGYFQVAVPKGPVTLLFKPGPVPYYGGPSTSATQHSCYVDGPTDVGDVVMPAGFALSASVREAAGGASVVDADIEVVEPSTGEVLYTPDNQTNAAGFFQVVIPEGSYDVRVLPKPGDDLSPLVLHDVAVPPATYLGALNLAAGFELRGRVRDQAHVAVEGATVALVDVQSGALLHVAGNVTAADGRYSFVVPPGTYDVTFSAPFAAPLGALEVPGVVVDGTTDVDGELPDVAFFTTEGVALPGTGGIAPRIAATGGTPRVGNLGYAIRVDDALGGGTAFVAVQASSAAAPFAVGGLTAATEVPLVRVQLSGAPGAAGAGHGLQPLPITGAAALVGQDLRVRVFVRDPGSPFGVAVTETLVATVVP